MMKRVLAAHATALSVGAVHPQTNIKVMYVATPAATSWLTNNGGQTISSVATIQTANLNTARPWSRPTVESNRNSNQRFTWNV